jgi:prepilin-type N-terminal cleavage/methylation domain-containing protein
MKTAISMIGVKPAIFSTPRRKKGAAQAFTLIEVLIAGAIGAVIFTALYAGVTNSFSMLNSTRANLRATQIMVSRMEGLRLCAWGNGTNQPSQLFDTNIVPATFTDYFYPQGLNGNTNYVGTTYSGTMTILTNPNFTMTPYASYISNLALVTVTVTWSDGFVGHDMTHTRRMSTYVSQFGEQNYIYTH